MKHLKIGGILEKLKTTKQASSYAKPPENRKRRSSFATLFPYGHAI
jgi:hypothetical protein